MNTNTALPIPSKPLDFKGLSLTASLYGLGITQAWIYAFNVANESARQSVISWQYIYIVIALSMVALAFISCRRLQILNSVPAHISAAIIGMLAICLSFSANYADNSIGLVLSTLALVVAGIFVSWSYLTWGVFYASLSTTQALALLFGSGIVAALLKIILFFLPHELSLVLLFLLAPLAELSCLSAKRNSISEAHPVIRFTKNEVFGLWKVIVLLIVFCFVNGVLLTGEQSHQTSMSPATFLLARGIEIVLCACVLGYTFILKKPFNFAQLWRITLVILATDLLSRIGFPNAWYQPLFSSICVNFIVLFVWLTLCDVAHHSNIQPAITFAIGWSCYCLPLFAGACFGEFANNQFLSSTYWAALLYLVLIVSTFCLEMRDHYIQQIFQDINAAPAVTPKEFIEIDARCAEIANKEHLTQRELEIMQMLCKGRTKAYIAESLYVTENTVKAHTKRLYAKLNVHSKKELQQLIDVD